MIKDTFFQSISNTDPYFKSAFEGESGSGKSYTSSLVAIGLHKEIKSKKPIVIFDSERSSRFLIPLFKEHNVPVKVRVSESLADMTVAMDKMKEGYSDIFLVDSVTRVWDNLIDGYMKAKNKRFMTMLDWMAVKKAWRTMFMNRFLNESYHAIICGRAGDTYSTEINEETGKREFFKSGIRMRGGKEDIYETSLAVLMEKGEDITSPKKKKIWIQATVLKDRNTDKETTINGKVFENPTYDSFKPAVLAAIVCPAESDVDPVKDVSEIIETDEQLREWKKKKDITLEKIKVVLGKAFPSSSAKDKAGKQEACEEAFGVEDVTWGEIEGMSLKELEKGCVALQCAVKAREENVAMLLNKKVKK